MHHGSMHIVQYTMYITLICVVCGQHVVICVVPGVFYFLGVSFLLVMNVSIHFHFVSFCSSSLFSLPRFTHIHVSLEEVLSLTSSSTAHSPSTPLHPSLSRPPPIRPPPRPAQSSTRIHPRIRRRPRRRRRRGEDAGTGGKRGTSTLCKNVRGHRG
jgi:hypothetical protein